MNRDIQIKLFRLQDEKYQKCQIKLIPTIDPKTIIGVRTKELRILAKSLSQEDKQNFLRNLPHRYFEENQLHAFIVADKKDYQECLAAVQQFLPYLNNWATCDQFSPKIFKKHKQELIKEIKLWLKSDKVYIQRFAIGMLLQHFLDDDFAPDYLDLVSDLYTEEYYLRMMIAWYFATALAKQYISALAYLENRRLDPWIHNKTIQKARESLYITKEQKEYLRTLKI